MNEIVKYDNRMNVLTFKGFGKMDMNLLMSLCSKMKDRKTDRIVMTFDQIKELANYTATSKESFIADLERMSERLMKVNSRIITDGKIARFVLFPTFIIDQEEENLTIAVNQDFAFLLNELEQYTTFELEEFIDLDSKYSKNLYRILKQWRTVGKYVFNDIDEFRKMMNIPTSYTNKLMMQKCVAVAIDEISNLDKSFKGFKCTPLYARKRGQPLEKLVFTWQAEKTEYVVKNTDQIDGQAEFSDPKTFDEYVKNYTGDDAPSPVALKIAKDIEAGRKKRSPKKNNFNNFEGRKYDMTQLERQILESQKTGEV